MDDEVDTTHLQDLQKALTERLHVLELQLAALGELHAPAHLITDINKTRKQVDKLRAQLGQVEKGQQQLNQNILAIQVALKGIVTKYEYEYLRRLAEHQPFPSEVGDGEYHYEDDRHHYAPDVYPRLKRLDDIGFIRPREIEGRRHLLRIVEDHGGDERWRNEDRSRFKLRDYVEITDAGLNYLSLVGSKYL